MDVKKQQIDFLSLSAHKFHGPKGVGALVARKDIPLLSIIEGGARNGAGGPERKTYRRLWGWQKRWKQHAGTRKKTAKKWPPCATG